MKHPKTWNNIPRRTYLIAATVIVLPLHLVVEVVKTISEQTVLWFSTVSKIWSKDES